MVPGHMHYRTVTRSWAHALGLSMLCVGSSAVADEIQTNATAVVTGAESTKYAPLLGFDLGKWRIEAPLSAATRYEGTNAYSVDPDNSLRGGALNTQLRVGLKIDARDGILPFLFSAEYEHDVLTGFVVNRNELPGVGLPSSQSPEQQLRKAMARVSVMQYLHAMGGVMTSHWGLGLLSNDGTQGWAPGNAQFNDPRRGDRVIRGMLATGPHGRRSQWFAAVAFDSLLDDDIMYEGDKGTQLVAALVYGRDKPNTFGAYFVRRNQQATTGRETNVYVIDATGKATLELTKSTKLIVEGEIAMIFGTTDLGPTPDFPEHKVRQLGAAA